MYNLPHILRIDWKKQVLKLWTLSELWVNIHILHDKKRCLSLSIYFQYYYQLSSLWIARRKRQLLLISCDFWWILLHLIAVLCLVWTDKLLVAEMLLQHVWLRYGVILLFVHSVNIHVFFTFKIWGKLHIAAIKVTQYIQSHIKPFFRLKST